MAETTAAKILKLTKTGLSPSVYTTTDGGHTVTKNPRDGKWRIMDMTSLSFLCDPETSKATALDSLPKARAHLRDLLAAG